MRIFNKSNMVKIMGRSSIMYGWYKGYKKKASTQPRQRKVDETMSSQIKRSLCVHPLIYSLTRFLSSPLNSWNINKSFFLYPQSDLRACGVICCILLWSVFGVAPLHTSLEQYGMKLQETDTERAILKTWKKWSRFYWSCFFFLLLTSDSCANNVCSMTQSYCRMSVSLLKHWNSCWKTTPPNWAIKVLYV